MRWWLILTSLLLTVGCSQKVVNFVNEDSDFGSYSSYVIRNFKVSEANVSPEGERLLMILETSLENQMRRRDYKKVGQSPDLLLRYELLTNLNSRTNVDQTPYSPIVRVNTRTFKESALLVELTDRKTRKLVWQASIDMKDPGKKPADRFLQEAIVKMFNSYLYRANSSEQDQSLISNE